MDAARLDAGKREEQRVEPGFQRRAVGHEGDYTAGSSSGIPDSSATFAVGAGRGKVAPPVRFFLVDRRANGYDRFRTAGAFAPALGGS